MKDNHIEYMLEAIAEARFGGPFGAVVVDKDGVIIGRGHNQVKEQNDPTCHGEVMAIRAACKAKGTFDLSGCTIYTTGEPCPMCLGAILWANIEEIYYGCNVDDTAKIGFRDEAFYEKSTPEAKKKLLTEVGRQECLKLYEDYLRINGGADY